MHSFRTGARWLLVWVVSNLVWALCSAASGAIVSALLKGFGVLDNAYTLVGTSPGRYVSAKVHWY